MKIKAVCNKHPESDVLFLEGTVSMTNRAGQVQGDDSLENVIEINLDVFNLYCTADDPHNHDIHFETTVGESFFDK